MAGVDLFLFSGGLLHNLDFPGDVFLTGDPVVVGGGGMSLFLREDFCTLLFVFSLFICSFIHSFMASLPLNSIPFLL